MKPLRLQSAMAALLLALGICSGCSHKKPVLVMPQQPPATAAPTPTPTPEPAETQQAEQSQAAQQPAATPADQAKTSTEKTKAKNGQHAAARKPAPAGSEKPGGEVARNTPPRKVIPADKEPAPLPGGQISPGNSPADASQSQISTEQLLVSAETNLNGINRQLSKDEEAMRAQIKEFINQSRKAATENDLARAHNLAVKARLLSDELIKQR
jgi:hypothetical protein